jgi:membrane-bound lytic murein transglycosylase B
MQGSWAGAMGHTQFMPSVFLRYALDYDGDGKRDLWGSLPDALASAANFLRGIGWQKEQRWGREVSLPENFPYEKAGLATSLSLQQWQSLGVRQANGADLPGEDMQASLLVPTGHEGPAFLVYDNFHVIMRWNRAEAYALAVGHLADRINGAGTLKRQPVQAPRLSREQIIDLQTSLNEKGFSAGEPDGVLGPGTRAAVSRYQKSRQQVADGFISKALLAELGITSE